MKSDKPPPTRRQPLLPNEILAQFLTGAQHWLGLALSPIVITAAVSALSFVAIGLLLRSLPAQEAGVLALLLAVAEIISLVGLHGTPSVLFRLYGAAPRGTFDWARDLVTTLGLAGPITVAGIVLSLVIYSFTLQHAAYLLIAALLLVAVSTIAFMFNSQERYVLSNILIRLPNALLILPAAATLASPEFRRLNLVLTLHALGIAASFIFALYLMTRFSPRGKQRISLRQRAEGLIFLGSSIAHVLSEQGLTAVAGVFIAAEQLAVFAAIAILVRPFRLLRSILGSILTPELIRRPRSNPSGLFMGILALSVLVGAGAIVLAPPFSRWFYQGQFDAGLILIPTLALAGAIQLISLLPRSEIRGRAPNRILNRHVLALTFALLGGVIAGGLLIVNAQLMGLALAVLLLEAISALVSFYYWLKYRSEFKSARQDSPIKADHLRGEDLPS